MGYQAPPYPLDEALLVIAWKYRDLIGTHSGSRLHALARTDHTDREAEAHVLWLCDRLIRGTFEYAMVDRVFGFIQDYLWTQRLISITAMKDDNDLLKSGA